MQRLTVGCPVAGIDRYDILIGNGLLDDLGRLVAEAAPAARYAIITDSTVAGLYGPRVTASFEGAGQQATLITFPAGESHKTRATWGEVTDALLAAGFGRDSCVVALGGGVVGDLAGFVAATYMRGVPLVQVPTTLLAMVDASIGGKVGVDTAAGKNLVGAFHQPRAVIADPTVLTTLPMDELRSGLAEAVKHAAIADAEHLSWIRESTTSILTYDPGSLEALVRRSAAIKAETVAADPLETGKRKILNFGHTIGHAIEFASNLSHGEAVSIGMVAAAALSEKRLGFDGVGRLVAALEGLGLPVSAAGIARQRVLDLVRLDKKRDGDSLRMVLLEEVGKPVVVPVDAAEVDHALAAIGI